jgi:hypothetical protein
MERKNRYGLTLGLQYEIEVIDKNGKIIKREKRKSHSWLKNFVGILKGEFGTRHNTTTGGGNITLTDIDGSNRTYPMHSTYTKQTNLCNLSALADAGDLTHGILVGSGDTPNGSGTYSLATLILHGLTSGKLSYGVTQIDDLSNPSGLDWQTRLIRSFYNGSGSSITVKEIGIAIKKLDNSTDPHTFLIARDVLTSPSSIPDGSTMTVRYIIKITIS